MSIDPASILGVTPPVVGDQTKFLFSQEDLRRFYVAKWKIKACEICEEADWFASNDATPFSVLPTSDGVYFSTASVTVTIHLRVVCRSCGNTKLLLAQVIKKWLDDNQ